MVRTMQCVFYKSKAPKTVVYLVRKPDGDVFDDLTQIHYHK